MVDYIKEIHGKASLRTMLTSLSTTFSQQANGEADQLAKEVIRSNIFSHFDASVDAIFFLCARVFFGACKYILSLRQIRTREIKKNF